MKSIITDIKEFPCLKQYKFGKNNNSSFIVLFIKNKTGTVVYAESNCDCNLGKYSEEWDMKCFEVFNGEVKLSN